MPESPRETKPNEIPLAAATEMLVSAVAVDQSVILQPETIMIDPETALLLRERRRLREQNAAQSLRPAAQPSSRRSPYHH